MIGLALGRDRITTTDWSRPLSPATGEELGWVDLEAALRELRDVAGPGSRDLDVALLPPIVRLRRIELPPLREDELRSVLGRDASRYLCGAGEPQLIGLNARQARRRSPSTYVVSFASAALVESVYGAAEAAGWRIRRVVSAYNVWETGARHAFAGASAEWGYVVVGGPDYLDALRLEQGCLDLCRRFTPSTPPREIVDRLVESPATVPPWFIVLGSPLEMQPLRDEVQGRGYPVPHSRESVALEQHVEQLIARWVPRATGGELVPGRIRIERGERSRRMSGRLLAGAAAMLLLSAGLELWGSHRELGALREQRAAIREAVSRAMELRETIEGVDTRLRMLAAAETGASRWSGVIADIAEQLPADAHLIALRGAGDSLALEGVAGRAAGVFESLQQAPSVKGVRADAPIRQEARDSAAPVERFTLAARLTTGLPPTGGTP